MQKKSLQKKGFSSGQRRVDTYINGTRLRITEFGRNKTDYVDVDEKNCAKREAREPILPFFHWTSQARSAGACEFNFKPGQRWDFTDRNRDIEISLCANGNIPMTLFLQDRRRKVNDWVSFESFTPGKISETSFQLPERCWKQ